MNSKPTLISIISFFAVSILVFYFLILPRYQTIQEQQTEIDKLEADLESVTNYFDSVKENLETLEEIDWATLEKKIGANFMSGPFYIPNMLDFFEKKASEGGMFINSITHSEAQKLGGSSQATESSAGTTSVQEVGNSDIVQTTFSLDYIGTYEDLKKQLEVFEKQACVLNVRSIEFSAVSGGTENPLEDVYNFKIQVIVYSYPYVD